MIKKYLILGGIFSLCSFPYQSLFAKGKSGKNKKEKMNVLFFSTDDMRAGDLDFFGDGSAKTPNMDSLIRRGIAFVHAYCQYPLSCPSRSSLLTGKKPTTLQLYGNREFFGTTYPDLVSLPKYFKQNGYVSLQSGKIFHGGIDDTEAWTEGGEKRKWSGPVNIVKPSYVSEEQINAHVRSMISLDQQGSSHSDRWIAVNDDSTSTLGDNHVADRTIMFIKNSKKQKKPFFIACGFYKPHSPLIAPKRFFDLYNTDSIHLSPDFASIPMVPVGFPSGSIRPNNADLFINRSASPEKAQEMKKAYLACISYVDWNVGRIIDELRKENLEKNTIIVFWSDHGYQLGEKGKWSKAGSLWEEGARVPFIIYDPRAKGNGKICRRIVELLDIYPTLVDLCGLPSQKGLEGNNLKPLLQDPDISWNHPAYTVWNEHGKGITGAVIRTEDWRYAEFFGHGAGAYLTNPQNDPYEIRNLVTDPKYKDIVSNFHTLISNYVNGKTELSSPEK